MFDGIMSVSNVFALNANPIELIWLRGAHGPNALNEYKQYTTGFYERTLFFLRLWNDFHAAHIIDIFRLDEETGRQWKALKIQRKYSGCHSLAWLACFIRENNFSAWISEEERQFSWGLCLTDQWSAINLILNQQLEWLFISLTFAWDGFISIGN